MTDQTPRTAQQVTVTLNRLTAACEAASDHLHGIADRLGDSMEPVMLRLHDMIREYQATRTDADRARDVFLSRFPDAEAMQDEMDRRAAERHTP